MICDLLITWRNCLARVLSNCGVNTGQEDDRFTSEYANMYLTTKIKGPWTELMKKARSTQPNELSSKLVQTLSGVYAMSLGYYGDAKDYLEKHAIQEKDEFMREIMGLGLVS